MKDIDERDLEIPSIEELEKELDRERAHRSHNKVLRTIILILLALIATAVIVVVVALPVLQISGSSMASTLRDGDIVVALKTNSFHTGDVIAFEYNNAVQIKRIIARAGDRVDIDQDGNVFVNGALLDEPYVDEKAFGACDIDLPFTVPEGTEFVMGDHRTTSIDSRNTAVGCINEEDIMGRLLIRIWPLNTIGIIESGE